MEEVENKVETYYHRTGILKASGSHRGIGRYSNRLISREQGINVILGAAASASQS